MHKSQIICAVFAMLHATYFGISLSRELWYSTVAFGVAALLAAWGAFA